MSLLMDALKKAEQEKNKAMEEVDAGEHPAGLSVEPLPEEVPAETDVAQEASASLGVDLYGKPSIPLTFGDAFPLRVTAHTVFSASHRASVPRSVKLSLLALIVLAVWLGAIWLRFHLSPPLQRTAAPMASPLGEKPVAPAIFLPPAQEPPATRSAVAAAPAEPEAKGSTAEPVPLLPKVKPQAEEPSPLIRGDPEIPKDRTVSPAPRLKPHDKRSAPLASQLPRPGSTMATQLVEPSAIKISKSLAQDLANPEIQRGYRAFQAGDYSQAESSYRSVLYRYPDNRDALLGLAAIAVRRGRIQEADRYYRQLLKLNPKDSVATAALLSLQGAAGEITEAQVKLLLDQEPNAPHLYFSLGNLYARQARWAEAEQAYFQASSLDPRNPDFAFNLAVSLDRLGQTEAALECYRRALALAQQQPVNFNTSQVSARIQSLSQLVNRQ